MSVLNYEINRVKRNIDELQSYSSSILDNISSLNAELAHLLQKKKVNNRNNNNKNNDNGSSSKCTFVVKGGSPPTEPSIGDSLRSTAEEAFACLPSDQCISSVDVSLYYNQAYGCSYNPSSNVYTNLCTGDQYAFDRTSSQYLKLSDLTDHQVEWYTGNPGTRIASRVAAEEGEGDGGGEELDVGEAGTEEEGEIGDVDIKEGEDMGGREGGYDGERGEDVGGREGGEEEEYGRRSEGGREGGYGGGREGGDDQILCTTGGNSEVPPWIHLDANDLSRARSDSTNPITPCAKISIRCVTIVSKYLDPGSLHVITADGAWIGRPLPPPTTTSSSTTCYTTSSTSTSSGGLRVIPVNDELVSKLHCEILYNADLQAFTIRDNNSTNGVVLNNVRLNKTCDMSEATPIKHLDRLVIGHSTFELHVHYGLETCRRCEPGCVKILPQEPPPNNDPSDIMNSNSSLSRQISRKQEYLRLKRKYGIKGDTCALPKTMQGKYTDRAEQRRKHASKHANGGATDRVTDSADTPMTNASYLSSSATTNSSTTDDIQNRIGVKRCISTCVPIANDNKGSQILKRMGWKTGEPLGVDPHCKDSIREPINVEVKLDQRGLGSGQVKGSSNNGQGHQTTMTKANILKKTKQRFDELIGDS